ncbi:putative Retrovirus-related Pol polyprotein from transposon TNT 1-94 [Cocos nucifera]|uniref:Putative Retrovirus-related Pol polyprotein from transposon TNT 1-94 n=1 Tax=Cocos nucifera TaxID=13894 RepID=A0A8K0IA43_COCNU|nr:putative Retrovirus-related Pol polyprotein from transposon TNT 1-94 [Cocos nucifera]
MSLEKRACATIRTCLTDEVLYDILEEKAFKGLWSRLHQLYIGKNMCNKLVLKKQLYSLRMQEGEDVAEHIQRFDRMSMDLLNIEVDLEEKDKFIAAMFTTRKLRSVGDNIIVW